jgi:pyruvate/2-oxoglutarate dehydrogenase complex dihydrolipoamide acyltransferase (E2) component
MVRSAFTAPHVTEWVEVDVTGTMESVERLKAAADVKVSPMLFACAALIRAAATFPRINSSWVEGSDGPQIQIHGAINLGIAVASPRGLLVPVIRDAQDASLVGLAQGITDIVQRARDGVTSPQELSGGTISLTNIGVFGIDAGTPILVPGQVAILAIGQVTRKPWVVHDASGQESLGIRDVMTVSLSFDHRVIDGELGSRVLRSIADYLRDPATASLISSAPLGSGNR